LAKYGVLRINNVRCTQYKHVAWRLKTQAAMAATVVRPAAGGKSEGRSCNRWMVPSGDDPQCIVLGRAGDGDREIVSWPDRLHHRFLPLV
jgi:hypothetical protein